MPGSQSVLTECPLCQHSVYRELVNMPQCQQVDSPRATAGELVSCCCAPRAGCRQEKPLRTRTILTTLHLHYTCYLGMHDVDIYHIHCDCVFRCLDKYLIQMLGKFSSIINTFSLGQHLQLFYRKYSH